jgi:hypothetical protein
MARVMHPRPGYRRLRLLRPDVQRSLQRWGYCVTDEYVDAPGLRALWAAYRQVADTVPDLHPHRFTPPEVLVTMDRALRPPLERLATVDARITPSVFQSKPSSTESAVDPHQDSVLVDERHAFGVYAWVPLADVDARSGALYVVPGSHRFGAWKRAPATGAELEPLRQIISERARLLPASAGQVVLFDHAAMHGSLLNLSGAVRVAVGGVIRPANLPTYSTAIGEATPKGHLELYQHPPAISGLSTADLARRRVHVGAVELTELTAGPRGFSLACRADSILRPGAPGTKIVATSHDVG